MEKGSYLLLTLLIASLPALNATRMGAAPAEPTLGYISPPGASVGGEQEPTVPAMAGQDQPAPSPDARERITLLPGTVISVRIADKVDSHKAHTGDLLTGIVDPSVIYNDKVLIPRGTEAHVRLVEDKKGGRVHGKAKVELELVSLVMNGRKLEVESDIYTKKKGVLASKLEGAGVSSAGAATDVATGADPGAAVSPVIAVFRAAKVKMDPGSRIAFTLTAPFTFVKPPQTSAQPTATGL